MVELLIMTDEGIQSLIEALIRDTTSYWKKWIGGIKYSGRWRQAMLRSALTLWV